MIIGTDKLAILFQKLSRKFGSLYLTLLLIAFSNSTSLAGENHSGHNDGHENHSGHHHSALEALPGNAPQVVLSIQADKVSGWNVVLETKNFTFTPESVNGAAVQNQGHAHIYINGKKAGRLYSSYYHLAEMPAGDYEIKVTLNADDHSVFTLNGKPIEASANIVSSKE